MLSKVTVDHMLQCLPPLQAVWDHLAAMNLDLNSQKNNHIPPKYSRVVYLHLAFLDKCTDTYVHIAHVRNPSSFKNQKELAG